MNNYCYCNKDNERQDERVPLKKVTRLVPVPAELFIITLKKKAFILQIDYMVSGDGRDFTPFLFVHPSLSFLHWMV